MVTRKDLSLAYSPGVAAACEAIVKDSAEAASLTSRANLVAVISNGTAVWGSAILGPWRLNPLWKGKRLYLKKFAAIDAFDLEINESNVEKLVDIIASLEPTFEGINLEDIKAPDCFLIEKKLKERLKIPVFHDDQHGTAIITTAAVLNGLKLVKKSIENVVCVTSGAGSAALACLDLLVFLGCGRKISLLQTEPGSFMRDVLTIRVSIKRAMRKKQNSGLWKKPLREPIFS